MKKNFPAWLFAVLVSVGVVGYLFLLMPYSMGYMEVRYPLFQHFRTLSSYPNWEHCMLVPAIVAGLVIWRRKTLSSLPVEPSSLGLWVIVAALGLYWAGYKTDVYYIGFASIHLLIVGLVLWFLGGKFFNALFFHLCFLGFMWPLIFLEGMVGNRLQLLMVDLAARFLNLVGVDCLRSGSALLSAPDFQAGREAGARFQMDVDVACSGMRSLWALMMVSALYGYIRLRGFWPRLILFAASIPFAILGNFFRIQMLVFGTLAWGAEFAIGTDDDPSWYHMLAGFLVFAVALGGIALLAKAMRKFWIGGSASAKATGDRQGDGGRETGDGETVKQ